MSSLLEHKRKIKEHFDEINDAIDIGIEKRPITLGFHCSACASELLEFYLHKMNLISAGKMIKHTWFKRPKLEQKISPLIERKLPVTFPNKEEIYNLIYDIEEERDSLIYGNSTKSQIEKVMQSFSKLKKILTVKLQELGEKVE